jgi:Ca2+-binding RTX toxin-like protein
MAPSWDASGNRIIFTKRTSTRSSLRVTTATSSPVIVQVPYTDGLDPAWGQLETPFSYEGTCQECTDDVGDVLLGGSGEDSLYGGTGNDLMDGGAGSDMIVGDQGDDAISAGEGNDRVIAGPGVAADVVEGGGGDDHLYVRDGAGDDSVDGGDGIADGCFADLSDTVLGCP